MAITLSNNNNQTINNTSIAPKNTISLSKGEKISLTKEAPGLNNILVGLGWDTNRYDGGFDFDLDASIFLLGEDKKVTNVGDFVFYKNKKHSSGSVEHMGDNLTGKGDGDDEVIKIDLSKVPSNIHRISFAVTIHKALERKQNFGQVENAYIRIINPDSHEEIAIYNLEEDFSVENAVVIGEIYKHNNEWKFNPIGSGFKNSLSGLCANFGINAV